MKIESVIIDTAVARLKVLANSARLRIALRLLDGEQAVGALENDLGIRQPNLSRHLAELRDAGIVATRRESRVIVYRLADEQQRRLVGGLLQAMGGPPQQAPVRSLPLRPQRNTPAATFAIAGARG